ncbi:MAG: hypothetical protein R3261_10795, partial [Alphaproteobacteria bacterium]|nr:hypothetical protein [Alphaproteobacteria bacterium]
PSGGADSRRYNTFARLNPAPTTNTTRSFQITTLINSAVRYIQIRFWILVWNIGYCLRGS